MKENKAVKVFIGGDNTTPEYKEKVNAAIEQLRKDGYYVYVIASPGTLPVGTEVPVAQCEGCKSLFRKEKLENGYCDKCFEELADTTVKVMKGVK